MRDCNSSNIILAKQSRSSSYPAQNYITPGIIASPLYKKFVPLNQRSIWYKIEKTSTPLLQNDPTNSDEKSETNEESVQKGSGNPNEIANLSVKQVLEKMKHPKCAKILKIEENKPESNKSSSVEDNPSSSIKATLEPSNEIVPSKNEN